MSDYSVTSEDGYERTYDEDEVIEVRKGDLRAVLDVATMSMDFGSGFLDNEQVEALRKMAGIIGIDPMLATPTNFVCTYNATGHQWEWHPNWAPGGRWLCTFCDKVIELSLDTPPDTGTVVPYVAPRWSELPRETSFGGFKVERAVPSPMETEAYMAALDEAGHDRDKMMDVVDMFNGVQPR